MAGSDTNTDGLWRHYWATWRTMFAIQSMSLILGLSIAIPVISLATGRSLVGSGDSRLSDTDLLEFLVGPNFPLIAIAVVVMWVVVHVFGYAAQLFTAHASYHGAPVSVFTALRRTGRSILPLVRLAIRFYLQIFLIALPFLLIVVGILALQIRDRSLSHYLAERPPEFVFALAFAFTVLAAMAMVILQIAARWVHVLPLVLFHGEEASDARRLSLRKSRPNRHHVFLNFALWAVGTPLMVLLLNVGWIPLSLWASKLLGHRLGLLALILSVLVFITIAIATLVGFISLTFLALQHVRLFRRAGLDSEDPPETPDPIIPALLRKVISTTVVIAGLLTIGLSYRWLNGLRIVDHAQVIAQRGASDRLPENTVVAILSSIDLGTDVVAVDVRQRADKELLVFADADFRRVAGKTLKLDDASEEDLASIDIGSWKNPNYHKERVPSLDQVIGLCDDRADLMLLLPVMNDDRLDAFLTKVSEQIEASAMEIRTRFVCARPEHVQAFRNLRPDWKIGFKSEVMIDRPIKAPVSFVIVPANSLHPDLVNNLHRQDIEVIAADTVDPVVMSAALSRGADGLLVTTPRIARKVLEERAVLNPGERLLVEFIIRIRDSLPKPETKASVSQ